MTELEPIGAVLRRIVSAGDGPGAALLRAALAEDHPDPEAIDRAFAALRRRPGDTWWCGTECLRCTGVPDAGSRLEEIVATYDPELGVSLCPECGAIVPWEQAPEVRSDPRCRECQGRESCPPTLRDGGAGGAGGPTTPAPAGEREQS